MPKAGAHFNKTVELYEKQSGLCWICGYPMLRPNKERRITNGCPNKWEANLDHIGERDGTNRPKKASHTGCNSARGHKDPKQMVQYLIEVTSKFQNKGWIISIFGKEVFEQLANPRRIPW